MDLTGTTQEPIGMIALNTGNDAAAVVYQATEAQAQQLIDNLGLLIPMVQQTEDALFVKLSKDYSPATAPDQGVADALAAYRERNYRIALVNYLGHVKNYKQNLGLPSQIPLQPMPKL